MATPIPDKSVVAAIGIPRGAWHSAASSVQFRRTVFTDSSEGIPELAHAGSRDHSGRMGSRSPQGGLSNLHLAARDPVTNGFVMLGETFKGMSDATLSGKRKSCLRNAYAHSLSSTDTRRAEAQEARTLIVPRILARFVAATRALAARLTC